MDELIGCTINELTILEKDEEMSKEKHTTMYKCLCSCGNIKSVRRTDIIRGYVKSCGCLNQKLRKERGKALASYSRSMQDVELFPEFGFGKAYFRKSNGYFSFDIEDIDIVKKASWSKDNHGYAVGHININGIDKKVKFHREVMKKHFGEDAIKDKPVDHITHNILCDRKENLRICPPQGNSMNNPRYKGGSNINELFISYNARKNKYILEIDCLGNNFYSEYNTLEEAREVRDRYLLSHKEITKFLYNPDIDVNNSHNPNIDGVISPFKDVNTGEDIKREVITPFRNI